MDRLASITRHLNAPVASGPRFPSMNSEAVGRQVFSENHEPRTINSGVSMNHTAGRGRPDPEDIVVVSAKRTPIGKANRGSFKDTYPDDLLAPVFQAVLADAKLDPKLVGDIVIGNVLMPGAGAHLTRVAQFRSGIPYNVPLTTVNRQCSSGLQAVMNAAGGIKSGVYDIAIAGGVESMSKYKQPSDPSQLNPKIFQSSDEQDLLVPMGITSENVAEEFGISREEQDLMGYESQMKAARAQKLGLFDDEIVPVKTTIVDKNGDEHEITVTKDDGVRAQTTKEGLAKLRPAFKQGGTTTAGNSSQVSDGAAAVVIAKRSAAEKHRLPILGRLVSFAVVGVPPHIMGIGPAFAIPEALLKAGLTIDDIDVYEINEAFASQATYCINKLGIPKEKLNPLGGAIALGHPLGCTGARQISTLLYELKRRGKRAYGVVSMCIGTGMGAAAVFEYPGR
ncbi:3-ketoacyl-CoA thiolase B, peroxisomal-like [Anneissia japonica]|uniref:3-ketoacyl-CoA thiolase B, peroxisomal-like n=1 Tax=Anneissia japonica TaxID=1529436 RepID=UPI001425883E|nr:3-ketoacyl-CoA thiolase B, peroxisomal-like [Anneissia japonica]